LANDFSNPFDSLIDVTDLQLNTDDDFVSKFYSYCYSFLFYYSSFIIQLLNEADLSVDPLICDDTYRMER
jgi:hypothetical protein